MKALRATRPDTSTGRGIEGESAAAVSNISTTVGTGPPAWASDALDQRIIDALVVDDTRLLGGLARAGIDRNSIRAYARSLGVSDRFIKECRQSGCRPAMRRCMKCEDRFPSTGIQNRLCRQCIQR